MWICQSVIEYYYYFFEEQLATLSRCLYAIISSGLGDDRRRSLGGRGGSWEGEAWKGVKGYHSKHRYLLLTMSLQAYKSFPSPAYSKKYLLCSMLILML